MSDTIRTLGIAVSLTVMVVSFVMLVLNAKPNSTGSSAQLPDDEVGRLDQLLRDDPVEALSKHGTPDIADRLAEQGVDLRALGWRDPRLP